VSDVAHGPLVSVWVDKIYLYIYIERERERERDLDSLFSTCRY
jgi:hypothetical protein